MGAVFAVSGNLFLVNQFFFQFAAADQVTADGEQGCDAAVRGHVGPGIFVAQDDVAGDSHGQHFQNVGGIVGTADGTTVENAINTGTIEGNSTIETNVGGLIGEGSGSGLRFVQ